MIQYPSPNFNERPEGTEVKYLILHYTGMATGQEALNRLCDPDAKVSAHYLVEEDGRIISLVPEEKRAWHAGVSYWDGDTDINGLSIGIEIVNPGHDGPNYKGNYRKYPEIQMKSVIQLCQEVLSRYEIKPYHIFGHSDVAPDRKIDPGEFFDWELLAKNRIGILPELGGGETPFLMPDDHTIQEMLQEYGYKIEITGKMDQQSRNVISAFQRHFRPEDFSGEMDCETIQTLQKLIEMKNS